ncbi:MAG: hypothetical protein ABIQ31_03015 [Ferruginibacter sp.]
MSRKIVYIVICCLFFINGNAQQEKVLTLLNKIRAEIRPIRGDSIAANCQKNIDDLELELPPKNATSINTKKLELLINTSKKFIRFFDGTGDSVCQQKKITDLVATTRQLLKELNNIKDAPTVVKKDALLKITIRIIDSATKKGMAASIAVIDSTGKPVAGLTTKKDSAGYYDVMLVLNRRYIISVKAEQFNTYIKEYTAQKNAAALTIGLQKADTATAIKDTAVTETVDNSPPQLQQEKTEAQPATWYVVAGLSALLLFFAILYFNTLSKSLQQPKGKKFRSIINPAGVFQKELNRKEAFINEINKNLEVVEHSLAQVNQKQQAMDSQPQKTDPAEATASTGRYFLSEIMMTSGPRKKFMSEPYADKDLGEDVCGFIATSNEVLLWLLDGTSDVHCLINPENKREYFSSRLQAQAIAEKLRKHFIEKPAAALDEIMTQAIQTVRLDWLEVIEQLPEAEKQRLKTNIANQNFPECSTTLLLSRLLINGDFTGYRSGDSKLLLFNTNSENKMNFVETSLTAKNPLSNDRMFFRIRLDEKGNFDILYNEPMFEIITQKDIRQVIAFSDGIGAVTEQSLKEAFKNAPDQIRQEVVFQTQGTADDKSICFLEIRQKGND